MGTRRCANANRAGTAILESEFSASRLSCEVEARARLHNSRTFGLLINWRLSSPYGSDRLRVAQTFGQAPVGKGWSLAADVQLVDEVSQGACLLACAAPRETALGLDVSAGVFRAAEFRGWTLAGMGWVGSHMGVGVGIERSWTENRYHVAGNWTVTGRPGARATFDPGGFGEPGLDEGSLLPRVKATVNLGRSRRHGITLGNEGFSGTLRYTARLNGVELFGQYDQLLFGRGFRVGLNRSFG